MQSSDPWSCGCSVNVDVRRERGNRGAGPVRNEGALPEMKTHLQGNSTRADRAENQVSYWEYEAENSQSEQQDKK